MMLPHSAQLGASSWILNATFAFPRDNVTVPPFPFEALGAATACPLVATTANSSRAGEEAPLETEPAAVTKEEAPAEAAPGESEGEPAPPTLGASAAEPKEPPPFAVAPSEEEVVGATATDPR